MQTHPLLQISNLCAVHGDLGQLFPAADLQKPKNLSFSQISPESLCQRLRNFLPYHWLGPRS